jgi:hypothetical protein
MSDKDKTVRVFTGSEVEAAFICSLLEENGIGAMYRNSLRESLLAGWVSGAQEDSCRVFVTSNDEDKAKKVIETYLEKSKEESSDEVGDN